MGLINRGIARRQRIGRSLSRSYWKVKIRKARASLGLSHLRRFWRLGEFGDLKKAIKHYSRAVDLAPGGHPELPDWLKNLGVAHAERFDRLDELNDIEKPPRLARPAWKSSGVLQQPV
ncbi:hypothetical protein RSAG8_03370, partial [Rhizoctonia solani AG-8 WAC10335]